MAPSPDDPRNLTGSWSGHYRHDDPAPDGRSFPIHATFRQSGGGLSGAMRDEVTVVAGTYGDLIRSGRLGLFHRVVYALALGIAPESVVESELPAESSLSGRVRGESVEFTKRAPGPIVVRYHHGATVSRSERTGEYRSDYRGVLLGSGRVIEGTWSAPRPGPLGRFRRPAASGTFTLTRHPRSAAFDRSAPSPRLRAEVESESRWTRKGGRGSPDG